MFFNHMQCLGYKKSMGIDCLSESGIRMANHEREKVEEPEMSKKVVKEKNVLLFYICNIFISLSSSSSIFCLYMKVIQDVLILEKRPLARITDVSNLNYLKLHCGKDFMEKRFYVKSKKYFATYFYPLFY